MRNPERAEPRLARRRNRSCLSLAVAAAFVTLAGGCDGAHDATAPARQRCRQVAEHVVDLQLGGAALAATDADLLAHRDNLRALIDDAYLDHCEVARDPGDLECALTAADLDAVHACDTRPSTQDSE